MKMSLSQDRVLFHTGGGSERYVRLVLEAPRAGRAQRLPLSLALVLDRSGSMSGAKFELAREAALRCLSLLAPTDHVALIAYGSQAETILPSRAATPATLERLRVALAGLKVGSSTNLEGGWLAGAAAAASAGLARMRVLLLTDGLANVGETHPIALGRRASELRERGLLTSTIGIGDDFDEGLLGRLADLGGGNFHHVERPEQFDAVLAGEIGEATSPYAEEISVHVTVSAGASCAVLGDRVAHTVDDGVIVRVGALAAGRTTDVVLRVSPGKARVGSERTLRLATQWTSALDGARHAEDTQSLAFIAAASDANRAQERHAETIARAVELRIADAMGRALEFNRRGEYEAGAQLVRAEHDALRDLARHNPRAKRLLAAFAPEREHLSQPIIAEERIAMHTMNYSTQRMREQYGRTPRNV